MTDDDGVEAFAAEQPRLLGLAYRLLGSLADAEDVCQEAWLRWSTADRAVIERPAAWLTTVTTRLSLDRLTATKRHRETYVGPWLPEPVVMSPTPEEHAVLAESLTIGFLAVLEQLDPVSRVVFVLADVFGLSFDEIAITVGRTPASARQLAVRARRKVRSAGPRPPSPAAQAVVDRLFAAVLDGDVDATMALLADDVVLVSDGGPNRHAARHPIVGSERVTRFVLNLVRRLSPAASYQPAQFNGSPGVYVRDPDYGDAAISVDIESDQVARIWIVSAPEKLRTPAAVALR
ncbi:MAG: RNA polymerase sigma factor SigJ [Actinomycetota bacterium]|nr:RNA polymerase sigma factor SigJ [Actinomycetota bacterium]